MRFTIRVWTEGETTFYARVVRGKKSSDPRRLTNAQTVRALALADFLEEARELKEDGR